MCIGELYQCGVNGDTIVPMLNSMLKKTNSSNLILFLSKMTILNIL